MATAAQFVSNWSFEIAVFVTLGASNLSVPAVQREIRGLMIELIAGRVRFPANCRVALLAGIGELGFRKCSPMRIGMAVFAPRKREPLIFCRRFRRSRGVTFCAGDVLMEPSQRKLCAAMIKFLGWLPCGLRMAAHAVRAQLRSVRVLMAGGTLFPESQK